MALEKILAKVEKRRNALWNENQALRAEVETLLRAQKDSLPEWLEKAKRTLAQKGCDVIEAASPAKAGEIVEGLVGKGSVVHAYSPLLMSCGLPKRLQQKGLDVAEMHFGALAAEWAETNAAHPDFPAGQLEEREILEIFHKKLYPQSSIPAGVQLDRREILTALRQYLRTKAEKADYGISGVSAVIAEHGSIVLGEDAGHMRAVSNLPPFHIAIVDSRQIVPNLDDAVHLVRSQAINKLGRDIETYLSIISGPSRTADIEFKMVKGVHGPKKVFTILINDL
jgi:L-lactate dehydrogenase complex protein LldG